jgi:hypothetical protein
VLPTGPPERSPGINVRIVDSGRTHELVPYLVLLEQPFDPEQDHGCAREDLIRFALGLSDYWADKALDWLESGGPVEAVKDDLRRLVDDRKRPQPLQDRALRALDRARRGR